MVKGLRKLSRNLKDLADNSKRALQAEANVQARSLNVDQRSFVPVDDGTLRASIRNRVIGSDRIGAFVMAGGSTTTREVREGSGVDFDYAIGQEFGTERHPASPFFYGPYRVKRPRIRSAMSRAMTKVIRAAQKNF